MKIIAICNQKGSVGKTAIAVGGTDVKSLQDIGGWKSAATAIRYINSTSIANKGAKYGEVR